MNVVQAGKLCFNDARLQPRGATSSLGFDLLSDWFYDFGPDWLAKNEEGQPD